MPSSSGRNPPADAQLGFHVANAVRESLLVLDAELSVVAANGAFYRTFQVTEAQTLGCRVYELGNGQWDIPALRELLEAVLTRQSAFDDFEVDHDFEQLGRRVMWLNARELVGSEPPRRLILLAIADVTERRNLEAELERQRLELARSNAELERFATVASHDLQEPLRKIQTYGELLRTECAAELDAQGIVYVERMAGAAARMRGLIDDLLALSRIATRPRPHVPVDLGRVLRDVLTDLDVAVRESGARVDIGALPVVRADPVLMRQLLQNLLSNAIKFRHPERTPAITIRTSMAAGAPGMAEILVGDNGIGFAPEYAEHVFHPFTRLNAIARYAGTGIGLAICQRIVERHGGRITAESAPGLGTTIRFALPLGLATPVAAPPLAPSHL